jgi:hypothetical protein
MDSHQYKKASKELFKKGRSSKGNMFGGKAAIGLGCSGRLNNVVSTDIYAPINFGSWPSVESTYWRLSSITILQ